MLTSVCTGSWIYAQMGLLERSRRRAARNRTGPSRASGQGPDRPLGDLAPTCEISRARVVDAGRIITAGGVASGMELGFHLLRGTGYDEEVIGEVARVMEYEDAYRLYRDEIQVLAVAARPA